MIVLVLVAGFVLGAYAERGIQRRRAAYLERVEERRWALRREQMAAEAQAWLAKEYR